MSAPSPRDTDSTAAAGCGSPPLHLASVSPRRKELLRSAGYQFSISAPATDESAEQGDGTPESLAVARASAKARSAAERLDSALVIGADTIVVLGERIIGKPADREDARRILRELSGTAHRVVTGLALIDAASGMEITRAESTEIVMESMSQDDIEEYVSSGEADDKAGAYAIQETGDRFVRSVNGSLTNVVGLPMEALEEMLNQMKWRPDGRE